MTVPTHCNLDLPNVPALQQRKILWGFELKL
jgi:hypothetical protein